MDDPSSATTVVRFGADGEYRLRLTASDGELESSAEVVVDGRAPATGTANVAPIATPSASFTASWNDVNAVNNGEGRNSGGAQTEVWGTWSGNAPATRWLQYSWDTPQRVSSATMMFWFDSPQGSGNGVVVPDSWVLEYRDLATGEWAELPGVGEYGTSAEGKNEVSFGAVSTDQLRATFHASEGSGRYSAVGVAEWEVFADAPESLEELHVRTDVSVVPELPTEVAAVYADGSRGTVGVTWPAITEDQVAADGSFTVTGIADGTPLVPQVTVWVRATPPGQINTIDPVEVTTRAGVAPQLPATVVVQYNDGSREMLPVTWSPVEPPSYAESGTSTVDGTVEEAGTTAAVPP
ncbi:Ig-like domain-containing protein [Georgenia sp. TF02-10]|uniref:Ig-like domain-containing protein n=1 Tax=Georgenia sp. TF02-10 TaxID=2917725 RepID=UPI001FA77B70|nr:Ig-like domain-containing protein [Georgenia sp. TF02-10]UNX54460.1 Ig-like domain-containing protein [Georgenia sp. TF02-10]